MKTKSPKMTQEQKNEQNRGSRFIRDIPAPRYAEYLANESYKPVYDKNGRRVK